jgi:hypothetical protein
MSETPQIVLWAKWSIIWPLAKLLKYKPLWYTGRALVRLFGYKVIGQPGKGFFVGQR